MKISRATARFKLVKILAYLFLAYFLLTKAAHAEVTFNKKQIKLGNQTLEVEIADEPDKHALGLMNRTELKDGKGMLFIFGEEQPLSFWMKNTLIPLTVGYFDQNKKLFQTVDMKPASPMEVRPPSYPSNRPGMYALEVPSGWFTKHNVKIGSRFSFVEARKAK